MREDAFLAAVLVMAGTVFLTRLAGAALMARFRETPALERFLAGLSASVVAALVASLLIAGDERSWAAVAVAVGAMLLTRSAVLAMLSGMLVAIAMSALASF